jgi:hypothetical protein
MSFIIEKDGFSLNIEYQKPVPKTGVCEAKYFTLSSRTLIFTRHTKESFVIILLIIRTQDASSDLHKSSIGSIEKL